MKNILTALALVVATGAYAFDLPGVTADAVKKSAESTSETAKNSATGAADAAKKSAEDAAAEAASSLNAVSDSVKKLLSGDAPSVEMKDLLSKFTGALGEGKDAEASGILSKLGALKPTEEQTALLTELKSNFAVVALGRDFDPKDPASSGAVAKTITAIKSKDPTAALTGLQDLWTKGNLSDDQKGVVSGLITSYGGKIGETAKKAAESVNQATEALKGFGF